MTRLDRACASAPIKTPRDSDQEPELEGKKNCSTSEVTSRMSAIAWGALPTSVTSRRDTSDMVRTLPSALRASASATFGVWVVTSGDSLEEPIGTSKSHMNWPLRAGYRADHSRKPLVSAAAQPANR